MSNTQPTSRVTRRNRGEVQEEDVNMIPPPSSNLNGELPNEQEDGLEGTDNPVGEDLDGEALVEERRDQLARSMDSYQGAEEEEEKEDSEDATFDAEEDDGSSDVTGSSVSPDSSGSDSSSTSSDDESSGEDSESLSSDSSDDSSSKSEESEDTVRHGKKRKHRSIRAIDKKIEKAIRAKEKAKVMLAKGKSKKQENATTTKHGKRATSKKQKSSLGKKNIKKENGIKFQKGAPCKSLLPTLQAYWGDAIKNLSDNVPLTVLNPTFVQKDKVESRKNQSTTSSSKSTRNRGLNPPSEYAMTFGEWIDGIMLLRRYLKKTDATECWMVALRYDIMFREQLFGHRGKGVPVSDASIHIEKFERLAKEKATRNGELSFGDANPYAKGARFENRDPITGLWDDSAKNNANKRKLHLIRQRPLSSNNRRLPRLPREPRLPDIIEMLPPLRQEPPREVRQRVVRGAVRRGRGGVSTGRGRGGQQ
ncbi:uncharacterized protein MELLADRAFT_93907 [Melampsora larici-populina 98AG31]|uniref:Uncharacterized protein n=1 Tax=Melampsora larici-populina (strain 98AG31 / pathotype 3-4-7) TaxID=747676 RepID=F4S5P8_MELLP|nr:uncharacterized protein MELLADRAFT_93907 [Melampsora larici-populina 98AG31]EGG00065.1 hypothetical protein MELLADRAFT_93907 [Melampsora larici-populina 98AG31]